MIPNKVLSKEMSVKPLKEGEVARFRLLNAHMKQRGIEEPTTPEYYLKADREYVWDPFKKEKILIGNVIGQDVLRENGHPKVDENGNPRMAMTTKSVQFKRGYITCTHEDDATYQYLMRSKANKSNPFAPKRARKVFELESDKQSITEAKHVEELRYNAETIVRKASWMELKAIRVKLNESPDKDLHIKTEDLEGMKLEMIALTKKHPRAIIWSSSDERSKMLVQIYEGMNFGFLSLNDITSVWSLVNFEAKEPYRPLITVEPGKAHYESLVDYFVGKGQRDYHQLCDLLKKALSTGKVAA